MIFKRVLAKLYAYSLSILLTVALPFLASPLSAQAIINLPPDVTHHYENRGLVAPEYLYHWLSLDSLNAWAERLDEDKFKFPFAITFMSQLRLNWPQFEGKRGVFAWINPVTGRMASVSEPYGEALMRFKIDTSKARVLRLVSSGNFRGPVNSARDIFPKEKIKNYDLIEHITPNLHEWVILNPKVILEATADPNTLKSEVKKYYQPYVDNPLYNPPLEQIHYGHWHARDPRFFVPWQSDPQAERQYDSHHQTLVWRITNYLNSDFRNEIPVIFLQQNSECKLLLP